MMTTATNLMVVMVLSCVTLDTVNSESPIKSCMINSQCSCITNTGQLISLLRIGRLKTRDAAAKQDFIWEPCNTFDIGDIQDVTAVQHIESTDRYFDIGTDPNIDFDVVKNTVQLNMASKIADRISLINLTCSHESTKWTFVNEYPNKTYRFELKSPWCCPGYKPSHHKSISIGTILTVTFFVILVMYLVFGVIFKSKVMKSKGTDRIPNKDFWTGLSSLIRDGIKFTVGCGSAQSKGYAKI